MAGYTAGTSYRQEPELVCSFSQFPTALGLRPGLRELLHRKRETRPNTTYLELGTLGEYITLELLRRLDPRWNQAVPAVPAYLPRDRRGLPCGQYCGCADLLLCTEEVLAVGEAKLLCTREMPVGEEVPADYRCQMEPEMRSNHLYLSYLIVLRFAQLPSKRELRWMRQQLQEGRPVLPVGAELRVWEYRRDERFWDQFVLPGLSRFEEYRRHAEQDPEFCPTKRKNHRCFDAAYRTPEEQRARAEECFTPGHSRLVLVHHYYAESPLAGSVLYCDKQPAEEEEQGEQDPSWNQAAAAGCERLVRLLGLE